MGVEQRRDEMRRQIGRDQPAAVKMVQEAAEPPSDTLERLAGEAGRAVVQIGVDVARAQPGEVGVAALLQVPGPEAERLPHQRRDGRLCESTLRAQPALTVAADLPAKPFLGASDRRPWRRCTQSVPEQRMDRRARDRSPTRRRCTAAAVAEPTNGVREVGRDVHRRDVLESDIAAFELEEERRRL